MKKIILTLFALLGIGLTAQADGIVSGSYYKICTADGAYALTNGGSTANNTILKMTILNEEDEGQIWQITASGNYFTITSSLGAVSIDNPSESHTKWSNQALQWKTSGGNNQKWTFKAADEEGLYYMIPYESSAKCYGYDANGTFTFQTLTNADNQKVRLTKVTPSGVARPALDGYYALMAVSTYPDYNYASEGKFVRFAASGTSNLNATYKYTQARLHIKTDANGIATITLPQSDLYVYAATTSVKGAKTATTTYADSAKFVIYANTDSLTTDTRVALHVGSNTEAGKTTALRCVIPSTAGSALTVASKALGDAFCFRLVALPAADKIEALATAISEATDVASELTGDAATNLKAAIATAQEELDYPYITATDVTSDIAALTAAVETAKAAASAAPSVTGITAAPAEGEAATVRPDVYDLQGRKVKGTTGHGVFVVGGKKVIK